jgi:hypothetical protein
MTTYQNRDAYRIVDVDGGVRVLMPGGFSTTALEERYPSVSAAAAAIADAIGNGMPALEVVDETASPQTNRASRSIRP